MKEDVLEQLVEAYLQQQGYFTRHNIKFRPSKEHPDYNSRSDCVHSDIDVIGFNPKKRKSDKKRVVAVSCKSWQRGFRPKYSIDKINNQEKYSGRQEWKKFRELVEEKWAEAFVKKIKDVAGTRIFTYITAVTHLSKGNKKDDWENHASFKERINGNPIEILTVPEILDALWPEKTTPEASEVGRMLQLIKASGWRRPDKKS